MQLSADQLKRAWVDCKVYKRPEARVELIDHYSYLVKITAGRLVANLPNGLDKEDLIGAGVVGLVKGVDQYDPTREVKFETYAIALIRGAILEMLREEDWVPRSVREKLKALEKAQTRLERENGYPATIRDLAEHMRISENDVRELMSKAARTGVFSLDDIMVNSDGDDRVNYLEMVEDDSANPEAETAGAQLRRLLVVGVDRLIERERLVVSLYYYEGLTFKEIGRVLGVSESRIYQLHALAMQKLKEFIAVEGGVEAAYQA